MSEKKPGDMRCKWLCFALEGLFFLLAVSRPVEGQRAAGDFRQVVGRVVGLSGHAGVRRYGRAGAIDVSPNLVLFQGDILKLTGTSKVKVLCRGNLKLYEIAAGEHSVPCRVGRGVSSTAHYGDSIVADMRLPALQSFPQVVAPRMTRILDPHPTLRWTSMPGEPTYSVSVNSLSGGTIWHVEVKGKTELVYPNDAPPLVAGDVYKLTVLAGGDSSAEEGLPGLTFQLLAPRQARVVRLREASIQKLPLTEVQKQSLVADLYWDWGLRAEALARLRSLSGKWGGAAVTRSLGDMYLELRLLSLAEEQYLLALSRAKESQDTGEQAFTRRALGVTYQITGNDDEARKNFAEAERLFLRLGDTAAVNRIKSRMKNLTKP
jgi:hypothetical protein